MILAILINGRLILAVDSTLTPGTLIADGATYEYGDTDILKFVTGGSRPMRPASVIISGSSVREYAAALLLLGVAVNQNLLSSLALNPINPDTGKGKLTGLVAKVEPGRQGVTNAATLQMFVRKLLDFQANTHIQEADAAQLRVRVIPQRPPAQA